MPFHSTFSASTPILALRVHHTSSFNSRSHGATSTLAALSLPTRTPNDADFTNAHDTLGLDVAVMSMPCSRHSNRPQWSCLGTGTLQLCGASHTSSFVTGSTDHFPLLCHSSPHTHCNCADALNPRLLCLHRQAPPRSSIHSPGRSAIIFVCSSAVHDQHRALV